MSAFGTAALGPASSVVAPPTDYWRGPKGKPGAGRKVGKQAAQHEYAGYSPLDLIVNFVCWAFEQREFPTPEAIQARFSCSRATAYRLRASLAKAYGIEPPRKDRHTGLYVRRTT